MKSLKKTMAALVAGAVMLAAVPAFAAITASGEFTSVNGAVSADYRNIEQGKFDVTVDTTKAVTGQEMTFVVLDTTAELNGDGEIVSFGADDILYIDQKTLLEGNNTFTAGIAKELSAGESYPVRVGYYYDNDGTREFTIAEATMSVNTIVVTAITGIETGATADATCNEPLELSATVTGTGDWNKAYSWAITSPVGTEDASISGNTFTATKVGTYVVTVTADGDSNYTKTKTITVVDSDPKLTSVSFSGSNAADTGTDVELTAAYVNGGKEGVTINWSLVSATVDANAVTLTPNGKNATVTSSVDQTVRVKVRATSTTGVVKEYEDNIVFSTPEQPTAKTVTIIWGDVNTNGTANTLDATAIINAYLGTQRVFTKDGYTYTWNSNVVTTVEDGATKSYTLPFIWGDVNANDTANTLDATAIINAYLGTQRSFTKGLDTFTWGESKEITLTPNE